MDLYLIGHSFPLNIFSWNEIKITPVNCSWKRTSNETAADWIRGSFSLPFSSFGPRPILTPMSISHTPSLLRAASWIFYLTSSGGSLVVVHSAFDNHKGSNFRGSWVGWSWWIWLRFQLKWWFWFFGRFGGLGHARFVATKKQYIRSGYIEKLHGYSLLAQSFVSVSLHRCWLGCWYPLNSKDTLHQLRFFVLSWH